MKRILIAAGLVLLGFAAGLTRAGEEKKSTFVDGTYGYSIEPPVFAVAPEGHMATPLIVLAPATGGFATNVNVTVQAVKRTRKEYRDQTLGDFKKMKAELVSEADSTVAGREAWTVEYKGLQQGRPMHWLSKSVLDKERVVLVTATTTEAEYGKHEAAFKACLESLELE